MRLFRSLARFLFCVYVAVFPGSTLTVALDRVPAWGEWMGGALLILQGAIVLCWLVGYYGRRGAFAVLLVGLLAWGVEYAGVTTGFPFGRYSYTAMLQPQIGAVPLAIVAAWLMVAIGAWQLASGRAGDKAMVRGGDKDERRLVASSPRRPVMAVAATLVLLLDLQIETVATAINRYWVWLDGGPYYGVPTANFVAWWLVGLGMALLVGVLLNGRNPESILPGSTGSRSESVVRRPLSVAKDDRRRTTDNGRHVSRVPTYLYLLSTLMFTAINLARGYVAAGLIGVMVLLMAAAVFTQLPWARLFIQPPRTRRTRSD
jgi:uncharacterized membrane protein